MRIKLFALVVAAAFASAAFADNTNVTIYGTFNVDFESVKASGGTSSVPSRTRISPNSGNIGFKGSEDLGNGLKAFFQVENAVDLDVGGSAFASRNSNLGISGELGTLFFGRWDTLHKQSTGHFDSFGTAITDLTGVFGGGSICNQTNDKSDNNRALCFQRRQNNVVQYNSPILSAFQAKLQYGPNRARTSAVNPNFYAGSLTYNVGSIFATYIYALHKDFDSASGAKATNNRLGVSYKIGALTLALMGERIKANFPVATTYTGPAANPISGTVLGVTLFPAASDFKQDAFLLSFAYTTGPNNFRGGVDFNRNRKLNGTKLAESNARQIALGYGYNLSKRTEVYAIYTHIRNDSNSANTFATNPLVLTSLGQDPRGFGAGIKHSF